MAERRSMSDTTAFPPPDHTPRHLLIEDSSDLDVPTENEMLESRQQTHDAIENAEIKTEDVKAVARGEARRTSRRLGLAAILFAFLVSVGFSVYALSSANSADSVAAQANAQSASARQTVADALNKLNAANDTLQARGQQPVAPPTTDTPASAIESAVLAQVLAALPPSPTADQVATKLQTAVLSQVVGPSQTELAEQVAAYYAAHPPLPGPAPTQAQIQAAVDADLAANPPPAGAKGDAGMAGQQGQQGVQGPAGTQGPKGDTGPPGPSLTDQQIQDAIAAYLAAHPISKCPDGTHLDTVQFGTLGASGQGCVNDT